MRIDCGWTVSDEPSGKRVLVFTPRPPRLPQGPAQFQTLVVDILDLGIQGLSWLKCQLQPTANPASAAEIEDISFLAGIRDRRRQLALDEGLRAIEEWSEHYFEPRSDPGGKHLPQAPLLREAIVRHLTAAAEAETGELTPARIRWACAWIVTHLLAVFEDSSLEADSLGRDTALSCIQSDTSEPLYEALRKMFLKNAGREAEVLRRYELRYTHFMVAFTKAAAEAHGISHGSANFKILEDLMAVAWLARCTRGDRMKPYKYAVDSAQANKTNVRPAPVPKAGPGRGHLRLV